ncbi:IS110 family transposase [Catenulispora rubra]|uniref:IS110 family transposase n=1 Tax=Catenulispora rubra TaxID=280293 RepID=UPI00189211B2|nr:IS110 family transposase [Catenulispora rubra]
MAHPDVVELFGGVDTHSRTHHAAVIDRLGRHLADAEFPATAAGYRDLHRWLRSHGDLVAIGVEGTGSYGAGLARHLTAAGGIVVEVDRPDRRARRNKGKSDPIDAYAAATAVACGQATGTPKTRCGQVEAIRALRVARTSAVKSRTQAINQIRALLVTAPEQVRGAVADLGTAAVIDKLSKLRPGADLSDPANAVKTALRVLARRYLALDAEACTLQTAIAALVTAYAPALLQVYGAGVETASQLLVTAGDNPQRLRSAASFAALCGVAPVPASSGKTHRHRLCRGGDRQANRALHAIALTRMSHDPRTRAYVARRTAEGLSKKEIMRCLKRYIANEIHRIITPQLAQTTAKTQEHNPHHLT